MSGIYPVDDATPTANKYSRGWLAIVRGASGVADVLKWVKKNSADAYEVIQVAEYDAEIAQIAALADPNADRILFWDDSAGSYAHLATGTTLAISTTTINHSGIVPSYLDISVIAEPAAPGSGVARLYAVNDNGFEVLEITGSDGEVIRLGEDTFRIARNTSGSTITEGQLVDFTGSTEQVPNVGLARANSITTMPAIGVAVASVANNARGRFLVIGKHANLNTSAFTEGDVLYVSSTTAGAYTATRPAHPNFAQAVGTVERSHATQGIILFSIPPHLGGQESGTNRTNFTIGDQGGGAETLTFDNGFTLALSATPTANRTLTLPDATTTLLGASNIGVSVQAYDATLAAIAAYNTNGILTQTAADTFTGRTITGTANEITVTNGSGVSGNPTLSLPTGIDATKIGAGGVTSTEFGYIGTLTSDAQTQIDTKGLADAAYFNPPGPGVINATNVTVLTSNLCGARYLGYTDKAITSVTIEAAVTTGVATGITWAEVALASAASVTSGNLTLLGSATSVTATWNTTGNKTVTFSVSIPAGTHVYLLFGSQATTPFQCRATIADELGVGLTRTAAATRPSTMASPTAFSTSTALTAAIYTVVRWS